VIRIRAATPADAGAIAAIYAPHVLVGTASFETEAPDAAGMAARMAASDGLYPWLVATTGSGADEGVVA
jgi:L-amino acid N-acyltransferase YncA